MGHKTYKDFVIKLDSATGVLTAITGSVNSLSIAATLNLLDDSGMGDDDKTYLPGMHGKVFTLAGWLDSTVEGIIGPLIADRTSLVKTLEVYNGIKYYNGEVRLGNQQSGGSVDTIETWSVDATVSAGLNRTSVAL